MEPNGPLRFYPNDGEHDERHDLLIVHFAQPVNQLKNSFLKRHCDIPYLLIQMSHSARGSVGLFWLNAAEGWVDIKKNGQVSTCLDHMPFIDFSWLSLSPYSELFFYSPKL